MQFKSEFPDHSIISWEKVIPIPEIFITPTITPTAINKTPVTTIFWLPRARASKISLIPILLFFVKYEAKIIVTIAIEFAYVGE